MTEIQKAVIKIIVLFILSGFLASCYEAKTTGRDEELTIQVEEICNVMILSYTADKNIYEEYHGAELEEDRQRAEQARMRANKTASAYNKYIEENGDIFKNGIPKGVKKRLDYIY